MSMRASSPRFPGVSRLACLTSLGDLKAGANGVELVGTLGDPRTALAAELHREFPPPPQA